ncbi:MAG TPA: sialidase family protein [Blastocatellia bacterium]|nr:sialidase family protein [Blastocatellia bacterium]
MINRRRVLLTLATVGVLAAAGRGPVGPAGIPIVSAQFQFGSQRAPAIDVGKSDNLYLTMSVATGVVPNPHSQIFFTKSGDGGASWDNMPQTRNLSKSNREDFGPSIAVNRNGTTRVYIVFHNNNGGGLYLVRSKKKTKFRAPSNLTPDVGGVFSPRVALDSIETVNIVWGDISTGVKRVLFFRSTDRGSTFNEPIDVSRSPGEAFSPEIAMDPGEGINVVWEDTAPGQQAIMFARSTDGGSNFSDPIRVSQGEGAASEPHIAADSLGGLHVVWADESEDGRQAFYSHSTDGGQTFSSPINISRDSDAEAQKLVVTTFGRTVYVAYNDSQNRSRQVLLAKSDDGGATFSDPIEVSEADRSKGRGHSPAMVVDSTGKLHIVWIDSSIVGNDEGVLFYSNSTNGRRFSKPRLILAVV